jgi:arsenate reductase (thioredoxin)
MAQGFLHSFDKNIEVHSAGTKPAKQVNQTAVKVMSEVGIDISKHIPKTVDIFLNTEWDYVITVCDNARETCPLFIGKVKQRLHMGFEDPADITGSEEFITDEYRRIRDQIKVEFHKLYIEKLKTVLK